MRSWSTFDARTSHRQTQIHKTHKIPHDLDSRESTTFPFIVFSMHGHEASTQMSFCPKTPKLKLPKFSKLGFSRLRKLITFYVGFWLKWGLKQGCIPCQKLFNDMCHATYKQVNQGDSWLLVVKNQIANLTFNPSFGHNLCFKCLKSVMQTHFRHLCSKIFSMI
jgi:hypothetical protein